MFDHNTFRLDGIVEAVGEGCSDDARSLAGKHITRFSNCMGKEVR
ncbi:MAG: hypothetical protein WAL98_17315 [Desulfatiglandaceae bacterium]|jgi:hypothetical protein